jgi:hypothetical protein
VAKASHTVWKVAMGIAWVIWGATLSRQNILINLD